MKPTLIILSDLWGIKENPWIIKYKKQLISDFYIEIYDINKLAQINIKNLTEDKIHEQFIKGGIKRAISKLIVIQKRKINVLAFSIGGYIAWEACFKGLKINNLYAISSTRLRMQEKKPDCNIKLFFGEHDYYKPNKQWFKTLDIEVVILKNKKHDLYKDDTFINSLSEEIKNSINE